MPPRPEPSGPERSAHRVRWIALASLLAVWLAFDYPILQGRVLFPVDIARSQPPASLYAAGPEPHNPLGSDAFELYYPWRSYLGERLRSGDLPLWDPHRFAGTPYAANTQMAVWYPPNLLYAVGGTLLVTTALAAISRLATLLLAYWFFRILRLHPYAAAAGAVVFVFCGFQIAWGVHPTFLASSMWLPLALGGIEVAIRGRPRRGVPLAALGLALSVLAGHAQVALYVWLAAALWAAVSGLAFVRDRRRAGGIGRALARVSVIVGAAFALAAGLASIQILATAELSSHIVRGPERYEELVASALPARHLAGFVVPDRFGDPTDDNYVGDHNYTETAAYVGVVSLSLALMGIALRRDRRVVAFGLIGVVGLLSALGTPFYRFLYTTVPGISQTRAIGRIVLLVDVALAGLAALGLDTMLRERGRRASVFMWSSFAVAVAVLAVLLLVDTGGRPGTAYLGPRVAAALVALGLGSGLAVAIPRLPGRQGPLALGFVALIAADLWVFGFGYFTFQRPAPVYPEPPEISALEGLPGARPRVASVGAPVLPVNAALVHDLYDIGGSDTFILTRTVELLSVAQDQLDSARLRNRIAPFSPRAADSPVLDLLGVAATLRPAGSAPPERSPLAEGRFAVIEEESELPSAFVACWEAVPAGSVLDRLRDMDSTELRSVGLVEDRSGSLGNPESCRSGGTATLRRYEAEWIEILASAPSPSLLVLTDAWYPGWEATVDGRPAPVLIVDHALRGVPIGSGSHLVELAYRPGWLVLGAALTLVSAVAAGGYALRPDRRLRQGI